MDDANIVDYTLNFHQHEVVHGKGKEMVNFFFFTRRDGARLRGTLRVQALVSDTSVVSVVVGDRYDS